MRKIKTLTLFKTIQRYYCLVIYAFMLCLYGVITASAFLCGSSAGSVEYELLEQRSQIFDIFFSGSRLGSFVSAMMFFAIIFLSALLLSVVIKCFNRSVVILTAAAYTALFIKLFSELDAGNFAESIVYRRNMGLLAVAELAVFFAVACRRMDVKR